MAISLLMIGHFYHVPQIACGALGVEFFFLLSGFLMGRILFVNQTPLGVFYRRRIARIIPAAYFFLFVMIALSLTVFPFWRTGPSMLPACFLFVTNYAQMTSLSEWLSPLRLPADHFWSLGVEEHTYIYLSLLSLVNRKARVPALALLVVSSLISLGLAIYFGRQTGWEYYKVYWRSDCRAFSIFVGAIMACLAARGAGASRSYLGIRSDVLALGLVALGCLLNLTVVAYVVRHSLGTISLGLGLLLVSIHVQARGRASTLLIWLGTISYSLYLWQQPFMHLKDMGMIRRRFALPCALLAGVLSFYFIESPTRRFLNKRWGARRTSS